MSQHSSDVHILLYFSIYIFPRNLYWTGRNGLKYKFLIVYHLFPMSETFEKSQMSEFFDVSSGCSLALVFLLLSMILSKFSSDIFIFCSKCTSKIFVAVLGNVASCLPWPSDWSMYKRQTICQSKWNQVIYWIRKKTFQIYLDWAPRQRKGLKNILFKVKRQLILMYNFLSQFSTCLGHDFCTWIQPFNKITAESNAPNLPAISLGSWAAQRCVGF